MLLLCTSIPTLSQDWKFDAGAYAWLAGMDGTVAVGLATATPMEAKFTDLVGLVDFSAAGHFEARNPSMLFLADVFYVKLGAQRDATVQGLPVKVDVDMSQWILELGGGYRVVEIIDLLLAGRYYIQNSGATASSMIGSKTAETKYNWADVFVGARYHKIFGERWIFTVRGDIGTGGSDFAWFLTAFTGYQFSELFSTGVDFRLLSVNYTTGSGADYYKYDVTQSGLGVVFRFTF